MTFRKLGLHSPVHSAAGFGKVSALEHLLDVLKFPVDSYLVARDNIITPLHWAVFHKQKVRQKINRIIRYYDAIQMIDAF